MLKKIVVWIFAILIILYLTHLFVFGLFDLKYGYLPVKSVFSKHPKIYIPFLLTAIVGFLVFGYFANEIIFKISRKDKEK